MHLPPYPVLDPERVLFTPKFRRRAVSTKLPSAMGRAAFTVDNLYPLKMWAGRVSRQGDFSAHRSGDFGRGPSQSCAYGRSSLEIRRGP